MSEETVQSRVRAEVGLADLYRRYAPWLTARMRGRFGADAEDIVQDAWVRVAAIASAACEASKIPVLSLSGPNAAGSAA